MENLKINWVETRSNRRKLSEFTGIVCFNEWGIHIRVGPANIMECGDSVEAHPTWLQTRLHNFLHCAVFLPGGHRVCAGYIQDESLQKTHAWRELSGTYLPIK